MKLWLISQDTNTGYDTYDSAVVAAETERDAKLTHPGEYEAGWRETGAEDRDYGAWTSKANVKCQYIGEAAPDVKAGVVCASFNAG